ncbi:tetratricopeptide repeat protein [Flagellimonas sp. CMM7]|uniref:tetratricopeptide repeat protein n=1 Tax=Flagellimonas sp. CMM7 TaxID=2654676 RepID=UPI0013D31A36|nr:tetratricopeptide repeat protein [Flagellimonas sp. CMM7]UII79455.1 tetratricopeptide repeat protein [Flagellimonas sp. CMM7]
MKKLRFCLAAILFAPLWCLGQLQGQERIDSLLAQLNTLEDGIPKIKTLEYLYYAEVYNQPEKGLEYARKSLELSTNLKDWSNIGKAYYHIGVYHKLTASLDSAKYYYNKSLEVWNKHPNIKQEANTLSAIARIDFDQGQVESAIEMEKKVTEIFRQNGFWLNYGNGLGSVGSMYQSKGNYKLAYDYTLKSIKVLDTVPEEPWRDADSYAQLGSIEYNQGNYKEAIIHYEAAQKIYKATNDNIYMGHNFVDMGSVFVELNEYDKAIDMFDKALKIAKEIDVPNMQANSLSNLGMTYSKKKEYSKALGYLLEAEKINKKNNSILNVIANLGETGNAFSLAGQTKKGIDYLNKTIQIADSAGALDLKKQALFYRYQAFKRDNKNNLAFNDIENYLKINDSIFSRDKSRQIEELKTIYETEKKEAEIALQEEEIKTLNEKAKVDRLTKGLYAGGMASALGLFGLSVFGYRQRIKKNRIAREKQEEIYKQEIEHKKKELTSQTLHLVQKNTFIQELKENLENLKSSPEKFKVEFRRIVMLLKKQNASDKDWEVFKSYFSEVHNDFDQKLKTLYPDISEKEIRLAAFLRMNLTTKEIAATLNVLPESILKSKYRLKKKLELDKEMDLTSFLNTL